MKIALYPGSFDPLSNGHLDIIKRASMLFDKVYILVSINATKTYIFSDKERVELVKKACSGLKNVVIESSQELVIDYARKVKASCIIRGLRNHSDFDAEMQLYHFNHAIESSIETIFLFPTVNNLFLSSSSIKELVMFNADIAPYVPSCIKDEIEQKLKQRLHK